jgi:hypothetical protein
MNYKYTDLAKDKNYIGFESGIYCSYPNDLSDTFILNDASRQFDCQDNEWYKSKYLKGEDAPNYYDPRCRNWYKDQY